LSKACQWYFSIFGGFDEYEMYSLYGFCISIRCLAFSLNILFLSMISCENTSIYEIKFEKHGVRKATSRTFKHLVCSFFYLFTFRVKN